MRGLLQVLYLLIIHLRKKLAWRFVNLAAGGAHLNRPSNYYSP